MRMSGIYQFASNIQPEMSTQTASSISSKPSMCGEQMARLTTCLTRLQDQLERMGQVQAETTLALGKLSGNFIHLNREVESIKMNMARLEANVTTIKQEQQAQRMKRDAEIEARELINDPTLGLPLSVRQPCLGAFDPCDFMTALVTRKARVLIVEDDTAYQWLVRKHLESQGVECVLASNAASAIQHLQSNTFDLILMDIQLPGGLNGVDAARRIRTFNAITPIVSMTASAAPRQVAIYLANGMNDVLPKPFSKDNLLTLVSRFCQLNISTAFGTGTGTDIIAATKIRPPRSDSLSIEEVFELNPDTMASSIASPPPPPEFKRDYKQSTNRI